jgi:hypothetical protein
LDEDDRLEETGLRAKVATAAREAYRQPIVRILATK